MVKIGRMVLGSMQTNCYFIYDEDVKKALIVDPADAGELINEAMNRNGFTVEAILLTHGHGDHIWGVSALKKAAGVKVYALDKERELLESTRLNLSELLGRPCTVEADEFFTDGQKVTLGGMEFTVIATPGHTSGSCCYYFEQSGILASGDTLFYESTGRTDFPTGSSREIVASIKEKLFVLPENVQVYSGHGDITTIGHEIKYNPFVQ